MAGASLKSQLQNWQFKRRIKKATRGVLPNEFRVHPEVHYPGNYAAGLRVLNLEFSESSDSAPSKTGNLWEAEIPNSFTLERLHAMDWMDDLVAVKTVEAERKLRVWVNRWIKQYGAGDGIGWRLDIIAWRVIRFIMHAEVILADASLVEEQRFMENLGLQVNYLHLIGDLPTTRYDRILVLVARLYAAACLDAYQDELKDAARALEEEVEDLIVEGAVYLESRNPEALAEIFCLLVWSDALLADTGHETGTAHDNAIEVIGKSLRALRLGGRHLLSVHGGGGGNTGAIDRALSLSHVQGRSHDARVLGFALTYLGNLNFAMDAATPPYRENYERAQASTLGIWVNDGQHPILISRGIGSHNSLQTRLVCQETLSHSCLLIDDESTSVLASPRANKGEAAFGAQIEEPSRVSGFAFEDNGEQLVISAAQNGYFERFGLMHERKVAFDLDGQFFSGLDILNVPQDDRSGRFEKVLKSYRGNGLPLKIMFHLAPKIVPNLDVGGESVSFQSPTNTVWAFRQIGGAIEIEEDKMYLPDRKSPVPIFNIVVRSRLLSPTGYLSWSFQAFRQ